MNNLEERIKKLEKELQELKSEVNQNTISATTLFNSINNGKTNQLSSTSMDIHL